MISKKLYKLGETLMAIFIMPLILLTMSMHMVLWIVTLSFINHISPDHVFGWVFNNFHYFIIIIWFGFIIGLYLTRVFKPKEKVVEA